MPDSYKSSQGTEHAVEEVPGLVDRYLVNAGCCCDVAQAQFEHAVGKTCLDWLGIGPEQVSTILQGVNHFPALFRTDLEPERIGLKGKALENFFTRREEVKRQPLWRFLHALGVEGLGTTSSKEIALLVRNWQAFSNLQEWRLIELLGEVDGKACARDMKRAKAWLEEMASYGCIMDDDKLAEANAVEQTLAGKIFVITGTLSKPRDEMAALIEKAGGLVKGSVGKAVHFVICGDDPGKSKLDKATKLGVPMITEAELYAMMTSVEKVWIIHPESCSAFVGTQADLERPGIDAGLCSSLGKALAETKEDFERAFRAIGVPEEELKKYDIHENSARQAFAESPNQAVSP